MSDPIDRRRFLRQATAGLGTLAAASPLGNAEDPPLGEDPPAHPDPALPPGRRPYAGPNVILVRFGGGVRRRETILDPERTYCPFIYHELYRRQGVLYPNVEIESAPGVVTSHGQGTLYLLTGRYDEYHDVAGQFLGERFEPPVPTVFEYLRRTYDIPAHQALLVNGEDRINEEFYTFSNHRLYGVRYRSTVLSLYRFKTFLLREQLADPRLRDGDRRAKERRLREMESRDYRVRNRNSDTVSSEPLNRFWRRWRAYYGDSGLVNPRGDRLLTTLALWALRELRPRLLMINYQDTDYVHWGNPSFYTRAISVIDEGVREIYSAVQADEEYRDRTVFVVVPDCGRDNNRCADVPFQHHFNTASAHEIFAVLSGPRQWVPHSRTPIAHNVQQIAVARTVGQLMGFAATDADAASLLTVA
jgi:hypothetical protein